MGLGAERHGFSVNISPRVKPNVQGKGAPTSFSFLRGTEELGARFSFGVQFLRAAKGRVGASRGRGRVVAFKASETHKMKAWDLRTVTPFCLLSCVPGTPGSLQLCFWQPSAAGAVVFGGGLNLPGHFCARADCGRQRAAPSGPGRKGARACARPWKPRLLPRPRLESQETKSRTRRPIGAGWGG